MTSLPPYVSIWQYMLISTLVDAPVILSLSALTVYVNFYSRRLNNKIVEISVWQYMLISTLVD